VASASCSAAVEARVHRSGVVVREVHERRFACVEVFGQAPDIPVGLFLLDDPVVLFVILFVERIDVFENVVAASRTDRILPGQRKAADRTLLVDILLQLGMALKVGLACAIFAQNKKKTPQTTSGGPCRFFVL